MKILISGSSGLVGSALTESLFNNGHTIGCLQRDKDSSTNIWLTENLSSDNTPYDVVIHLAGENIGEGLWTKAKKQRIYDSRIKGTQELVDFLIASKQPPQTFITASAVGYYGSRNDESLDEASSKGTGFLSDVCQDWEKEANRLKEFGTRVINMRFGMVLSPHGGALSKMLPPFKAGLGGKIGSGNQHISWVSLRDIVAVVPLLLEDTTFNGPVNVVSPNSVTNLQLTKAIGAAVDKPAVLSPPVWLLKLLLGKEMVNEMLLASTKAKPEKLLKAGYNFKDDTIEKALAFCIKE